MGYAMLFRQLFDATSSTYTYLLADESTREGVLVDTVYERHARDAALVRELDIKLVATLDTHCHADHVSGAWLMKQAFGTRTGLSPLYGAKNVDLPLLHGARIALGATFLEVRATPGHTPGCVSLVTAAHDKVLTGDALLVRGAGRTDFQGGDASALYRSIRDQLFTLPDSCVVYPGHDYEGRTSSTIGEEKRHNPRIGGEAREEDFVGYMKNLGLPHPKLLAVSLPANMRCGEPEDGAFRAGPDWAPLTLTYAGLLEIDAEWVAQHRAQLELVDVRSKAELDGDLGHLGGVRHIPLDELRERAGEIDKTRPVVCICQTGKRSGMATVILQKLGIDRVANLAGGMVHWRELELPS